MSPRGRRPVLPLALAFAFALSVGAGISPSAAREDAPGMALDKLHLYRDVARAKKRLEADPKDAAAWRDLASLYHRLSLWDEALAAAERLASLGPGDPRARYGYGVALQRKGRLVPAIAEYRAAIELDPKLASAWYNLANALLETGDLEGSASAADLGIARSGSSPKLLAARGTARLRAGKFESAAADLEAALAGSPGLAEARYNLACAFARLGKTGAALRELRGALVTDPSVRSGMDADADLESLRKHPEFRKLLVGPKRDR